MGLFGNKETCAICGETTNILNRVKISDGYLCGYCIRRCSREISSINLKNTQEIKEHLLYREQNQETYNKFKPTKEVKNRIQIDEKNKLFVLLNGKTEENPDVFRFDELVDYEFIEDGEIITRGGVGSAVVGGMLFGGVGAIVGANTGKKKGKTKINDMHIRISLNNEWISQKKIVFINAETSKNGMIYNLSKSSAEQTISLLDIIIKQAETKAAIQSALPSTFSIPDEILKYKNLLDSGIITQDEFDAKKKQLLEL